MAADNILHATNSMRSSVALLKKKLSTLKIQIEAFDAELDKIESKFDNLLIQADIYKSKVERESGREIRRLERELASASSRVVPLVTPTKQEDPADLKVASTIAIFDSLLRNMCQDADDFRLASEAFLFPAVYERVMQGEEEAYFIEEVPTSSLIVISRGKEYIKWLQSEYQTHLVDASTWADAIEYVAEWWRNDALPLLYGARDDQWEIDVPLSLQEMLIWKNCPSERPVHFSKIFDAYEIFRKHKEDIYESSGLRSFELKLFKFENAESTQSAA